MTDEDEWDLIVVGAGAAGLSAAVAAADGGARVLVFEGESEIGGSTMLSAGMFTAGGTSVQQALGIEDSWRRYYQHYMDLNGWRLRPGVIRSFCQRSAEALEWLLALGVEVPARLSPSAHAPGLTRGGVEDVWRGHVPAGEGYGLIQVLDRSRRERKVEVVLRTRVQAIWTDGGAVRGVVADDLPVAASSVLVASGGLTQDPELLAAHFPDVTRAADRLFVVSAPGSRGDHMRFAEQVDSDVGSDRCGLLLVTAYFQDRHHWEAGFPPLSRVLVDRQGRRFMDEDAGYNIAAGIFDDIGGRAWMIFDETARQALAVGYANWSPENLLAEADAGRTYRADDVSSLADLIGVPRLNLEVTLRLWNETLPQGSDPDFFRNESLAAKGIQKHLSPIAAAPFYAVRMLPAEVATSHTGLLIDARARVLRRSGEFIPGLYAAGEASGGILGPRYVGSGNAIASAVVNGRTAGMEVAAKIATR